jgi:hypothetical protein
MRRQTLLTLAVVATLAACARRDAPANAADSAIAAATAAQPVAKTPHVRAIELGRAVDSVTNRITGGVASSYQAGDTIYVSLWTEFVPEGTGLSIRMLRGKTMVDSIDLKSGAPNAEGLAAVATRFIARTKGWTPGSYRLEVLLDGVSQGLSDFEVRK